MNIEKDIQLAPLTTFNVGGLASYFVSVNKIDELCGAFDFARNNNLKTFILGGGSNIIFNDSGFDGLVIYIKLNGISFNDDIVVAAAGESWDKLVKESVERGHYALANLSNIPGSVGAAPVQNIGAYGVEVKDVIKSVEVFDPKDNKIKTLLNSDCKFVYRDSVFKNNKKDLVITSIAISLKDKKPNLSYGDLTNYFEGNESPLPMDIRNAVVKIRSGKFPDLKKVGTAGSFFKNPIVTSAKYVELKGQFPDLPCYISNNECVKIPLGFIIDKLGWRGKCEGGIEVYDKQALVLINKKNGTFKDVKNLSEKIIKDVKQKTGIEIEKEVTFVN